MYEYRDGGRTGDELVKTLVGGVADVLTPGGIASLLGCWEQHEGEDWADRVTAWLPPQLDAWVVQREVQDPAQYAETWARDGGHRPGQPSHSALVMAWLDDFAARGVEGVGFGVITLRLPDAGGHRPRLRRLEDLPTPLALGRWARRWLTRWPLTTGCRRAPMTRCWPSAWWSPLT
jgi:hypothetical protein